MLFFCIFMLFFTRFWSYHPPLILIIMVKEWETSHKGNSFFCPTCTTTCYCSCKQDFNTKSKNIRQLKGKQWEQKTFQVPLSSKIDVTRQKHSRIVWCVTVSHEFQNGHSVSMGTDAILFSVPILQLPFSTGVGESYWQSLQGEVFLDILCHGYRACDGWWSGFGQETFVLYWILRLRNPSTKLFNSFSLGIAGYLSCA